VGFPPLDPRLFSFNSRQGACPDCAGTGVRVEPDAASLLLPDRTLDGALAAFEDPGRRAEKRHLLQALRAAKLPLDPPVEQLTARQRRPALERTGAALRAALADDPTGLEDFTVEEPCTACAGTRLNPRARAVRIQGLGLADLTRLPVSEAARAIAALRFG